MIFILIVFLNFITSNLLPTDIPKDLIIKVIKEGENQIVGEEINIEMQTLNKERTDKSKQDVHKII